MGDHVSRADLQRDKAMRRSWLAICKFACGGGMPFANENQTRSWRAYEGDDRQAQADIELGWDWRHPEPRAGWRK